MRAKAIVVNLENLRMLITKDEVYVLSVPQLEAPQPNGSRSPSPRRGITPMPDSPFVRDLVTRLTLVGTSFAQLST